REGRGLRGAHRRPRGHLEGAERAARAALAQGRGLHELEGRPALGGPLEEVPREEGRRRQRRELTAGGTDAPRGALPAGRLGGASVALDEQGEPEAAADAQGRYAAL